VRAWERERLITTARFADELGIRVTTSALCLVGCEYGSPRDVSYQCSTQEKVQSKLEAGEKVGACRERVLPMHMDARTDIDLRGLGRRSPKYASSVIFQKLLATHHRIWMIASK